MVSMKRPSGVPNVSNTSCTVSRGMLPTSSSLSLIALSSLRCPVARYLDTGAKRLFLQQHNGDEGDRQTDRGCREDQLEAGKIDMARGACSTLCGGRVHQRAKHGDQHRCIKAAGESHGADRGSELMQRHCVLQRRG